MFKPTSGFAPEENTSRQITSALSARRDFSQLQKTRPRAKDAPNMPNALPGMKSSSTQVIGEEMSTVPAYLHAISLTHVSVTTRLHAHLGMEATFAAAAHHMKALGTQERTTISARNAYPRHRTSGEWQE